MSFQTFVSIFNSAFPDLKEKHKSVYAWERYFRQIAEVKFCLPREKVDVLSAPIEAAFKDRLEGSSERDKFEACMLCILDLVMENETTLMWNRSEIEVFLLEIERSHFDAYLLYKEIRRR